MIFKWMFHQRRRMTWSLDHEPQFKGVGDGKDILQGNTLPSNQTRQCNAMNKTYQMGTWMHLGI